MKFWSRSFNINLAPALFLLAAGCHSHGLDTSKKDYSTFRLYMEGSRAEAGQGGPVQIQGHAMNIETEPFLTEADVKKAYFINNPDGTFAIQVDFSDHGALVLDMETTQNRGRHLVVLSAFPPRGHKPKEQSETSNIEPSAGPAQSGHPRAYAWLAATLIRNRITSGVFQFTPAATREEAERIVRGLNNMVEAVKGFNK